MWDQERPCVNDVKRTGIWPTFAEWDTYKQNITNTWTLNSQYIMLYINAWIDGYKKVCCSFQSPTDPHFSPDEHLPRNRDIVPHRRRLNTSPNNRPKSPILDRAINSYRDRLNTTPLDRRPNSFNLDHRNQETHTPSFLFSRFDGRNNHLRPHYSLDSLLTPPRERRNIAGRHNFADRRDFAHSSELANRCENGSDKRRTSIRAMDLAVRRRKRESIYEVSRRM